jgi:CheY-like chemotaxis protein
MTARDAHVPSLKGPASPEEITLDQRLLFGWAHDCNSAGTLVLGYLSQLEDAGPFLPRQYALLQGLRQAVEYAVGLPRQLLALARGVPAETRVLDLRALVQALEGLLRGRMPPATNLIFRLCPQPARVVGDPQQLTRVLVNLATNAFEAMPYGGELILEVETAPGAPGHPGPNGTVRAHVQDTGPGIAPEVLSRLYEPMVSTRADRGGTGLGLYVVAQLVRQHGGGIDCETRPGQGTRFTISLPAAEAAVRPSLEGPHGQPLVLIVERDPDVRRLACTILSLARCAYRAFASVEEAREGAIALAGLSRAVLLDRTALRDDNLGPLQELLALAPDAGVVVTAADRTSTLPVEPHRLRAVLAKPYSSTDLISAVRSALTPP